MYKVLYNTPENVSKREWVNVEHITSRTLEEEKMRRKESSEMFKATEGQRRHKAKYHIVLGTEANESDGNSMTPSMSEDQINDSFDRNNESDESRPFGSDFIEIDSNPCGIGECQFLAISHKLRNISGLHMSGSNLRRLAIEHISRERQFY
jgi:hypothetical protein